MGYLERLIIVIVSVLLFVGLIFFSVVTTKDYKLGDYSCQEIKNSIINADCIVHQRTLSVEFCYNSQDVMLAYKLKCLNATNGN